MNTNRTKPQQNKLNIENMANRIRNRLFNLENDAIKNKMKRYFKKGDYSGLGISNNVVYKTIYTIQKNDDRYLNAENIVFVCEDLLLNAAYSEERLAAFILLIKVVKELKPDFLSTFRYWLENYVTTWAECDVLCLKTIYQFLLHHVDLVPTLHSWSHSQKNWCRRASNVAMIKFLNRKINKNTIYQIDKNIVFDNCLVLIHDTDIYVQKSIGWLLKEASIFYMADVEKFLTMNSKNMAKSTIRIAVEKMNKLSKQLVMK